MSQYASLPSTTSKNDSHIAREDEAICRLARDTQQYMGIPGRSVLRPGFLPSQDKPAHVTEEKSLVWAVVDTTDASLNQSNSEPVRPGWVQPERLAKTWRLSSQETHPMISCPNRPSTRSAKQWQEGRAKQAARRCVTAPRPISNMFPQDSGTKSQG